MKSHAPYLILVMAIAFAPLAPAQSPVELREIGTVNVPGVTADGFLVPIKCDSDSNVYFQAIHAPGGLPNVPIVRASPQGVPIVVRPSSGSEIVDFAPTGGGGLVILARGAAGRNLLEFFGRGGKLKSESSLRLWSGITPMQVAVARSELVFVSGSSAQQTIGTATETVPWYGIFDTAGNLVQTVSLPDDIRPPVQPSGLGDYNYGQALRLSSLQADDNGNFILARLSSDGPISVVSETGECLNPGFHPTIPRGALLTSVKTDGEMVVTMSVKKKAGSADNEISDTFFTLWDYRTGARLGEFYTSSPQFGAAFACYNAGVFTFLSTGPNGGGARQQSGIS